MVRGSLAACALLLTVLASSASPDSLAVDPQSLIGTWSGTWSDSHYEKSNGRYYLMIERVEGDRVFGKRQSVQMTTTEHKVRGRLSGNVLRFGKTELRIEGNQMRGASPNTIIILNKE